MLNIVNYKIIIFISVAILIGTAAILSWYYVVDSRAANPLDRELVIEVASKHFREAQDLILRGADVNHVLEHDPEQIDDDIRCIGWTPLHLATFWGEVDLVQFILENGGKPNSKIEKMLVAPLHTAITLTPNREGVSEDTIVKMVNLLLKYHANPNSKNRAGETPLDLAIKGGYLDVVKTLVENGARINAQYIGKSNPLFLAVKENRIEIVEYLLRKNVGVNVKNSDGDSALIHAIKMKYLECVTLLLNNKADVNIQNGIGQTPLHVAVLMNNMDYVQMLIARGADTNATDYSGMTPLLNARALKLDLITSLLINSGATK